MLDRFQVLTKLRYRWQESSINKQNLIHGVVDNVDQLFGVQARVDGVADITAPRDTEVNLEMAYVIPRNRRAPVTLFQPELAERGGQLA